MFEELFTQKGSWVQTMCLVSLSIQLSRFSRRIAAGRDAWCRLIWVTVMLQFASIWALRSKLSGGWFKLGDLDLDGEGLARLTDDDCCLIPIRGVVDGSL